VLQQEQLYYSGPGSLGNLRNFLISWIHSSSLNNSKMDGDFQILLALMKNLGNLSSDRYRSEHEMYPYKNRPFPTFRPEFRPFVEALIFSWLHEKIFICHWMTAFWKRVCQKCFLALEKRFFFTVIGCLQKSAQLCRLVVSGCVLTNRSTQTHEVSMEIWYTYLSFGTHFLKLCHGWSYNGLLKNWTHLIIVQNPHFCPE